LTSALTSSHSMNTLTFRMFIIILDEKKLTKIGSFFSKSIQKIDLERN